GAPAVPPSLVAQLGDRGRIVIPVGTASLQRLTLLRRTGKCMSEETREGCVFVPLVGRYGWGHSAVK
ncbi:MAG: protein-L-isoaspartate O-methyltransferase, partial [Acidobacteriota bacterium]|nr:protein-L-isoaspartate O-methyltransferase [Acidobacteriota bacterium]